MPVRLIHPFAVVAGLLLLAGSAHAGDWLDGLRLTDSAGNSIRGEALRNRPVLLQFWESWCRSCGQLMTEMDEVAGRFPDVSHLVVSTDDDPEDAWRRLAPHPLFSEHPERFFHDSAGQLAAHFEVYTVPTVLVVDSDGQERLRHSGHFNSSELKRLVSLLAGLGPTGGSP